MNGKRAQLLEGGEGREGGDGTELGWKGWTLDPVSWIQDRQPLGFPLWFP